MSNLEVPPFDMLTHQDHPFSGFGETTAYENTLPLEFSTTARTATQNVVDTFGLEPALGFDFIKSLDEIVDEMWQEGWDPHKANINLFTRDFGCLVTVSILNELSGTLVLRSKPILDHASIWWKDKSLEVFPFHVTFKRLLYRDGNTLHFFARAVRSRLELM